MVLTEIKEPGEYAHLIAAEYFDGIKAHVDEIAGKMYVQRPLLLKRDNLPPGTMGIRVIRSLAGLYREEPQHTNHQPIAPHAPELSAVDGIRGG